MINNIIVKESSKLIKKRKKKILVLTTLFLLCSSFGAGSRELSKVKNRVEETPKNISNKRIKKHDIVTVTFYNPEKRQCDSNPLITADNSEICLKKLKRRKIKWIAVSRDLLSKYSFGDTVRVSGDPDIAGIYEVHDTMNKRYTKRIDILTLEKLEKGVWKNIKIEKVS